jgi:roadblock/LC7 domain-containing protein
VSVLNIPGLIRGGQVEKYGEPRRWTGTVAAGQAATGGLLVEMAAGDRTVRTAQATSMLCSGVALHDAAALAAVTIASHGVWMLTADGTIASGNKVITATTNPGRILIAGAAPDARSLVGRTIADVTAGNLVPTLLSP